MSKIKLSLSEKRLLKRMSKKMTTTIYEINSSLVLSKVIKKLLKHEMVHEGKDFYTVTQKGKDFLENKSFFDFLHFF